MSLPIADSSGIISTIALGDAEAVPGTAKFNAGLAYASTGELYVCPLPASASDYTYVGGLAVRNDGALCVNAAGVKAASVRGIAVTTLGEVLATGAADGNFLAGVGITADGAWPMSQTAGVTPIVELGNFDSDASGGQWLPNLRAASQTPDSNIFGFSSMALAAIGNNNGSFTVTRNFATGPEGVASSAARLVGLTGTARTCYFGNNTGTKTFPAGTYTLAADVKANDGTTQTVRFGCANSGSGTYGVSTTVTNAGWTTITSTITKGATAAIQPVAATLAGDPSADFLIDNIRIYPGASVPSYATERATYDGHMVPDMRKGTATLVFSNGFVDNATNVKPGSIKLSGYPALTSFSEGTLSAAVNVTQNDTTAAKAVAAGIANGTWDCAVRNGRAYGTPGLGLNAPDNGTWISGMGTYVLTSSFNSGQADFYLNGALIASATGTFGPFAINNLGFMEDPMPTNGNTSQYALNPLLGKCGNIRVYDQKLSDAEVASEFVSINASLTAHTNAPVATFNYWIAEGDSLTVGVAPATESYWDTYFTAHPSRWIGSNMAVVSNKLADLQAREALLLRKCETGVAAGHRVIVSVWIGANEIPDQTQLLAYYDAIRATGAKLIAFTLTPNNHSTLPGGVEGYNTARIAFNAWLRTQTSHYDALADLGADAQVGARDVTTPDVAPNTYCEDYVHMNDSGYTVISGIVNPILASLAV